jgi:hypothetical protein
MSPLRTAISLRGIAAWQYRCKDDVKVDRKNIFVLQTSVVF